MVYSSMMVFSASIETNQWSMSVRKLGQPENGATSIPKNYVEQPKTLLTFLSEVHSELFPAHFQVGDKLCR